MWIALIFYEKKYNYELTILLLHLNAFIWLSCHKDLGQLWHGYLVFLISYDTNYLLNFKYWEKMSSLPQKYQLLSSGVSKDTDLVRLVYRADYVNSRSHNLKN